jgi:predicted metal-dependent hydrolase
MKWPTNGSLSPAARLKRRVDHWSVKLRVPPRVVRVQRMKRKWGSCSSGGTVTLATDLDKRSAAFQDYVIVHELVHLKVPNHSRLFKALMSARVPDWRGRTIEK